MVRPKKYLGQHFLKDKRIAEKIVNSLTFHNQYSHILEIGSGKGILTEFLFQHKGLTVYALDIDGESVEYLRHQFPGRHDFILHGNF
ncbi:MAG TPA: rRNA adenine N-6-methyltransferase family protein, partial [Cyclobacteriaceae bacterium]|nr:rRNA adenine N-6-methyltransferase family protein [Cyclobacteriaceae bacterium]